MKAAPLSLAVIAAAASTVAAAKPLKMFVFTNEVPSGSVDEQLKARRESLRDLVKILSKPKYQKTLTLVKSREGASVTKQFLKFRISAGQHTHDLATEGQLPWPKMAELAAEDLAKWIVEDVILPL